MPIYEYQCSECDHKFEKIQQISEPDPDQCPSCGGGQVGRLVSRSSFKLKGGGWFDDGYESTSGSQTADAPASDSSTDSSTASEADGDDSSNAAAE